MTTRVLPPARWGPVNQLFHWISAALLVAIGGIGLYMTGMRNGIDRIEMYALHKSLGLTLLAVVLLRLLWRHTHETPGPVDGMHRTLRRSAALVHWSLYALMPAMPLTGWLMNSAAGYPLQWFGLVNLPAIAGRDEGLRELAASLHEAGFWVLVALVVGHVFAALYHHIFLGDGTLQRMLPSRGRRPESAP